MDPGEREERDQKGELMENFLKVGLAAGVLAGFGGQALACEVEVVGKAAAPCPGDEIPVPARDQLIEDAFHCFLGCIRLSAENKRTLIVEYKTVFTKIVGSLYRVFEDSMPGARQANLSFLFGGDDLVADGLIKKIEALYDNHIPLIEVMGVVAQTPVVVY